MTKAGDILIDALKEIEDLGANGCTAARLGNIAHAALIEHRAASRPVQEPVAWQPIETAPKDGTRVLIADENVWMSVARFWPCNMYWIEDAASGLKLNEPTHWMPLPAPPVSLTGENEK